jgi:hypothetical protein
LQRDGLLHAGVEADEVVAVLTIVLLDLQDRSRCRSVGSSLIFGINSDSSIQ